MILQSIPKHLAIVRVGLPGWAGKVEHGCYSLGTRSTMWVSRYFSGTSWSLKWMKDLLQVRHIPVKEDQSFPILQEPSQQLFELFEEMREVVLQDRDLYDKVC